MAICALHLLALGIGLGAVWCRGLASPQTPDTSRTAALARTSAVQAGLVVRMVFAATAVGCGLGMN